MKLVGIDYGTKRVGVAVTDVAGVLSFPKAVFPNDKQLLNDLSTFIKKEEAEAIVIGESRNLTGEDNPVMKDIRTFARALEQECGLPVHFEPEFYTSHEARRLAQDRVSKNAEDSVDAQAAAIFLNSYLSRSTT